MMQHILIVKIWQTISNKILKDKSYKIGRSREFDGYQRPLTSMAYKPFDEKTGSGAIATSKLEASVNE